MNDLVFVDLETSGLDPHVHEPIEVGMVREVDGVLHEFQCAIDFDQSKAQAKALEVNGWGQRPFGDILTHEVAVGQIMGWLSEIPESSDKGLRLVANNVAFDVAFLEAFFRRNLDADGEGNYDFPWHYTSFDLKSLVAGKLGVSPAQMGTGSICSHTGIFPVRLGQFHTALDDARWNHAVYKHLKLWEG